MVSSLRSVRGMLDRVYPGLMQQRRDKEGEEEEEEEEEKEGRELAPLAAAGYVVQLLEPFVDQIHRQFTSGEVGKHPFSLHPGQMWSHHRLPCRPSGLHCKGSVWACECCFNVSLW